VSKNLICTFRVKIHIVGCDLCSMLVSVKFNIAIERIEVRASTAMVGGPPISPEVLASILRVVCAPGEDTTEVRFEERL
jgi:hypothetical protein